MQSKSATKYIELLFVVDVFLHVYIQWHKHYPTLYEDNKDFGVAVCVILCGRRRAIFVLED